MIAVQLANLFDVSNILAFGRAAHERSNYADIPYNSVVARRTVRDALANPNMRVFVAKKDGEICGLLIGMIDPMPWCAAFSATDLVFVATAGGDKLLDAFVAWCDSRKVARIDMGVSQEQDDSAITRLYEGRGFVRTGRLFLKQSAKAQEVSGVRHQESG